MTATLTKWLLVAVGGGGGSLLRFWVDGWLRQLWPVSAARFPVGILVINCLGCLVFGLVCGAAGGLPHVPESRRLLVLTGLLGGFTTFSTFGHDTARLLAEGAPALAFLNAAGSVVLGIAAVFAGLWIGGRWA